MSTLTSIMTLHQVEIPEHLEADAEIPVLCGLQRQGDVLVLPAPVSVTGKLAPIPPEGIAVVRGEAGGNTHLLVGNGQWAANTSNPAVMGNLVVHHGPAFLLHPQHGATGIGAGSYLITRQREQADVIRLVSD